MGRNTAYDMLTPPNEGEEVIEVDFVEDELVIEVEFDSDMTRVGMLIAESISLDGEALPIDENKNIDIPIGLAEINKTLNEYKTNRVVKVPFNKTDFTSSGREYELRIGVEKHKKGYNAIAEKVVKLLQDEEVDVFFQSKTRANGSVTILVDEPFDGIIYIKGVI